MIGVAARRVMERRRALPKRRQHPKSPPQIGSPTPTTHRPLHQRLSEHHHPTINHHHPPPLFHVLNTTATGKIPQRACEDAPAPCDHQPPQPRNEKSLNSQRSHRSTSSSSRGRSSSRSSSSSKLQLSSNDVFSRHRTFPPPSRLSYRKQSKLMNPRTSWSRPNPSGAPSLSLPRVGS